MDPVTVLVRIAAKHGIKKLIDALSGDLGLGDVASELFSELAASERQLDERLAGIERRFDEVLEQPYRGAIGTGLRTLLDAGTTSDGQVRAEELMRATALFREASAAARSPLQVAVAERYLVLCAIALGRRDIARTALGRLDHAALTALTQAGYRGRFQFASRDAADQAAQELGRIRRRRALEERTTQLVLRIQRGATDAGELSVQLLREAAVLAHGPEPHDRAAAGAAVATAQRATGGTSGGSRVDGATATPDGGLRPDRGACHRWRSTAGGSAFRGVAPRWAPRRATAAPVGGRENRTRIPRAPQTHIARGPGQSRSWRGSRCRRGSRRRCLDGMAAAGSARAPDRSGPHCPRRSAVRRACRLLPYRARPAR